MNFIDWLKSDHNGTIKLYILSWNKTCLTGVDKFQIISWKDGANEPSTSILTHSFRLSEAPGYVTDMYKNSQIKVDSSSHFMSCTRYLADDTYHKKDEDDGMVSFRALPGDTLTIDSMCVE